MEFAALAIGWLLGLASNLLHDRIRQHQKAESFSVGVVTELIGLKSELLAVAYQMTSKYGQFNKEFLSWYVLEVKDCEHSEVPPELSDGFEELLHRDDRGLEEFAAISRARPGEGSAVKEREIPFVVSQLGSLQLMRPEVIRRVLCVLKQLHIFNSTVHEARTELNRTFEASLSEVNQRRVNENLDLYYRKIGERARMTVTAVDSALAELNGGAK